jgi:V/A-type H+-transporting ATPase subunit F
MKFHLISDDKDTIIGMRLAGIDGTYVNDYNAANTALDNALADKDNGIVLITGGVRNLCPERVSDIKLNVVSPIVIEIPDSKGEEYSSNNIMEYVNNAIGVKM